MIRIHTCHSSIEKLFKNFKTDDCNKWLVIDLSHDKIFHKIIKEITGKDKIKWIINEYHTMREILGDWIEERLGKEISITIFFKGTDHFRILPGIVDTAILSITYAVYDLEDTQPEIINEMISKIEFNFIIEDKNA